MTQNPNNRGCKIPTEGVQMHPLLFLLKPCHVRLLRNTLLTIGRGVQGGSSLIEYRGCIVILYQKDLHTGLPQEEGGEEHGASPQLLRGAEPSHHHRPCHLRDGAVGGSSPKKKGLPGSSPCRTITICSSMRKNGRWQNFAKRIVLP